MTMSVNADACGMPHAAFAVTGRIPEWTGRQAGVVGYSDGQAVPGEKRLLLHATQAGRPFYRAMGLADGARMDLHALGLFHDHQRSPRDGARAK